jgi:hypothetical protein
MNRAIAATLAVALIATPATAQDMTAPAAQPLLAQPLAAAPQLTLPANTEILLSLNEELTSKRSREGDKFSLTVVHDVLLNDMVVIPKGSRGVGEVTWKTGKGAFGKSGKMEIQLRYLEANGRQVPIEGKYRQEGEGNTVATVAGVIAAGVFAGFITGKTAIIPQGRELKAHTREAVPVLVAAAPAAPVQAVPAVVAARAPITQ